MSLAYYLLPVLLLVGAPAFAMAKRLPKELVPPPARYGDTVTTVTWTDPSRETEPNGSAPGHPGRVLKTDIIMPIVAYGSAAKAPLIVFVHGLDTTRTEYNYLTRSLAQAGYAVVAADFPFTASSSRGGASDAHSNEQARDIAFLVDRLAGSEWSGVIDTSKYVVAGHSTGGAVALVAGFAPDFHDPRVAGVIAMAPNACFFSPKFFSTRPMPLAIVGATDDRYVPYDRNSVWAFRASAGDPAFHALATLHGGYHVEMTDYCLPDWLTIPFYPVDDRALMATMAPYGPGADCTSPPPRAEASLTCASEHKAMRTVVQAFADQMLRDDSGAVDRLVGVHGPLVVTATGQHTAM